MSFWFGYRFSWFLFLAKAAVEGSSLERFLNSNVFMPDRDSFLKKKWQRPATRNLICASTTAYATVTHNTVGNEFRKEEKSTSATLKTFKCMSLHKVTSGNQVNASCQFSAE